MIQIRHLVTYLPINLCESRASKPLFTSCQIYQKQHRLTRDIQHRRNRTAHIRHGSKCGHDKGQGRRNAETVFALIPAAGHGHGVLSHRDRNTERWAKLERNGFNCLKEIRILPGLTCRRHPVGTKMNVRQFADPRTGDVGDRLRDRHAATGRRIDECKRCPLAHRDRFPGMTIETRCRDAGIRYGNLPWPNHLIPHDLPADTSVTDSHKKGLIGDGRQAQYPIQRFTDCDVVQLKIRIGTRAAESFPIHPRRIAKE